MGEEHRFLKGSIAGLDPHRQGDSCKRLIKTLLRRLEGEGNQAGLEFRQGDAEASRDPIAEITGAEFRERESAGCDHQCVGSECSTRGVDMELLVLTHLLDTGIAKDPDAGVAALAFQHRDDLTRTPVTELLSQLFLMVGDPMFFNEADKVPWCVSCQGRFTEILVARDVVLGGGIDVGEVASPATRNLDFLSDPLVMFE